MQYVGIVVGENVGAAVGLSVGAAIGLAVGPGVGLAVGEGALVKDFCKSKTAARKSQNRVLNSIYKFS